MPPTKTATGAAPAEPSPASGSSASSGAERIALAQLSLALPQLSAVERASAAAMAASALTALPTPIRLGVALAGPPARVVLGLSGGLPDAADARRQRRALRRAANLPVVGEYLRLLRTLAVVEALEPDSAGGNAR